MVGFSLSGEHEWLSSLMATCGYALISTAGFKGRLCDQMAGNNGKAIWLVGLIGGERVGFGKAILNGDYRGNPVKHINWKMWCGKLPMDGM